MFNFFGPNIPTIDAKEVKQALVKNEKFTLLDVRTTGEYASGKIQKAVNLPLDQVQHKVHQIVPDKNARVYVYCRSGARSAQAVSMMVSLGYTNVFNMNHGLIGWSMNGFPLQQL